MSYCDDIHVSKRLAHDICPDKPLRKPRHFSLSYPDFSALTVDVEVVARLPKALAAEAFPRTCEIDGSGERVSDISRTKN